MKKVKVRIKDEHTLELLEDAKANDIIDLTELQEMDLTIFNKLIEESKDQIYAQKLNEQAKLLKAEHETQLQRLTSQIHQVEVDKEKVLEEEKNNHERIVLNKINEKQLEITKLNEEIRTLNQTMQFKINEGMNQKVQEFLKQINELNNSLISKDLKHKADLLEKEKELAAVNAKSIQEKEEEITKLKKEKELATQELNYKMEMEIQKNKEVIASLKLEQEKALNEKERAIQELTHQKAVLNVKQTGENLEDWCNNEVLSYMENGFLNCTWEKDNTVIKEEDETKGSKGDFIFKIYAQENHCEKELLSSACLDMKDENPLSVNKKKNEDYYKQLDKNRNKKDCKYAILVSTLEANKPNVPPIFKVQNFKDMYVVRPEYLMTFLNMLVSLTNRFKDLFLERKEEQTQFKEREQLFEEFDKLKDTYLVKPLELLKKEIAAISEASEAIKKSASRIDDSIERVTQKYIKEIQNKLDRFTIKKITQKMNQIEEFNH